ncbi:UNVERIFIED_CONTAM: hypothetical protein PYX00_011720 [Menopon gallinae]|uniref:Uncharacterized protein n=1 Tax=Menopon gallinae TaxID=328185 RepID=A0AAW2H8A2_9NEOP
MTSEDTKHHSLADIQKVADEICGEVDSFCTMLRRHVQACRSRFQETKTKKEEEIDDLRQRIAQEKERALALEGEQAELRESMGDEKENHKLLECELSEIRNQIAKLSLVKRGHEEMLDNLESTLYALTRKADSQMQKREVREAKAAKLASYYRAFMGIDIVPESHNVLRIVFSNLCSNADARGSVLIDFSGEGVVIDVVPPVLSAEKAQLCFKKSRRMLVSGIKMDTLAHPIAMSISKEEESEEIPRNTKRRSEVVEDEPAAEACVYEIADAENRVFTSKQVGLSSHYFAFINLGSSLRVVPLNEWRRFSLKSSYNEVVEDVSLSGLEAKEKEEEVEEIDYQEKFDDDNSEDEMQVRVEKKLSRAGKKMRNLMKTYEVKEQNLGVEDLRDILSKGRMTLKDLINEVRGRFKHIDERAKDTIRTFIKDECAIVEEADNKYVVLKE